MGAQIIAFLPRYLQATAEASALASPILGPGDLVMDHADTVPCEMPPIAAPPSGYGPHGDLAELCERSSDA